MVMSAIKKNPYIIGRPVSEAELFFDREKLFGFLRDTLPQAQVILLHGQRRIGKSSVLAQIPQKMADEPFQFVRLSLEGKSQKTLAEVLHELARDIVESLELSVTVPTIAELTAAPDQFADRCLVAVQAAIGQLAASPVDGLPADSRPAAEPRELVLLLDEFDALGNFHPEAAATHLFPYLSRVIQRHPWLRIVPVIGRRLDDLQTLLGLFSSAPTFEIGLLNEADTRDLITQPTEAVLFYEQGALQAIWDLTAGHPYFTQVLCFALFSQAREENWWQVKAEDVERVLDRALELGEGGLAWFWDGLPIPERVVFAAAATVAALKLEECRTQKACTDLDIREGEPLTLLEEFGISLTDCLHKAQQNLLDWNYLRPVKRVNVPETVERGSYKITIDLVRRWLLQRHGLKQEIWELEDLNPEVQADYVKARELRQQQEFNRAIERYEWVYKINPNHIGTIFELAECLLAMGAYSRAIDLYERAYQIDQLRARDGLLRSWLGQAQILIDREALTEAATVLAKVQEVDSTLTTLTTLTDLQTQLSQRLDDRRQRATKKEKSWGRFISDWQWGNLLGRTSPPAEVDDGPEER
jgi:hypothetical protein